jgi:hypothetical protein
MEKVQLYYMTKESREFQKEVQAFLTNHWNKKFSEGKINISGVDKTFDLVSEDKEYIGDVKYYKNIKVPAAKWSTIAEYVWLLEKTNAKKKFLVFGNDIDVPKRWLKRFGRLTNVEFYFFESGKLLRLN